MGGVDLEAAVRGVAVDRRAAGPALVFDVALTARPETVFAVVLQARVVIDAPRRRYSREEQERLSELFGPTDRWRDNLRPVAWADVAATVPGFEGETVVALRVPCTYDMEVASAKYFHGVGGAAVPLQFQFSGSAFVPGAAGIAVVRLARELEATWPMPPSVWHEMMDAYFPGWRWLRLSPARFDALARYKAERALPTWDATVDDLIARTAPPARSPG